MLKLLNKIKGDSAFSPKTKSPSGATTGGYYRGHPPKQSCFFAKKLYSKNAKHVPAGSLGEKMRSANSQRAKTGESGTAYTSGRIGPLPLTTLLKGYS
jgi:hypothetical protein